MASQAQQPIQREWMPYATAAKFYLGIAPDVLLGAIKRNELAAYEKPLTRGRKPGAATEHHSYFVSISDVDKWIRTYWQPAFPPA